MIVDNHFPHASVKFYYNIKTFCTIDSSSLVWFSNSSASDISSDSKKRKKQQDESWTCYAMHLRLAICPVWSRIRLICMLTSCNKYQSLPIKNIISSSRSYNVNKKQQQRKRQQRKQQQHKQQQNATPYLPLCKPLLVQLTALLPQLLPFEQKPKTKTSSLEKLFSLFQQEAPDATSTGEDQNWRLSAVLENSDGNSYQKIVRSSFLYTSMNSTSTPKWLELNKASFSCCKFPWLIKNLHHTVGAKK